MELSHTIGAALRPLVEWPFAPTPVGTVPFSSCAYWGVVACSLYSNFPHPVASNGRLEVRWVSELISLGLRTKGFLTTEYEQMCVRLIGGVLIQECGQLLYYTFPVGPQEIALSSDSIYSNNSFIINLKSQLVFNWLKISSNLNLFFLFS